MAKTYDGISPALKDFIARQHVFFVATAPKRGHINLSPKGMDSFRVMGEHTVRWLNLTGSGNETAAHLLDDGRITVMFCAFEGSPKILRLYGEARSVETHHAEWADWIGDFPTLPGARQIIEMSVDRVQTSCGFGVPLYRYEGDRDTLLTWSRKKGEDGIQTYWQDKNRFSIDGHPTGIGP